MATAKKETTKPAKKVEPKKEKPVEKKTAVKTVKAEKAPAKPAAKKPAEKPEKRSAEEKKAPAKKYHIAQRSEDNLWQVKSEGAEKALKLFKTQQEAIDYAKKVAGNQEGYIVIHKKDGSFRKLTY